MRLFENKETPAERSEVCLDSVRVVLFGFKENTFVKQKYFSQIHNL